MTDAIIVRRLGDMMFEAVPPASPVLAALAEMLSDVEDIVPLRRSVHASFAEAIGAAVTLASALGWAVKDETGQLTDQKLATAVDWARTARMKGKFDVVL